MHKLFNISLLWSEVTYPPEFDMFSERPLSVISSSLDCSLWRTGWNQSHDPSFNSWRTLTFAPSWWKVCECARVSVCVRVCGSLLVHGINNLQPSWSLYASAGCGQVNNNTIYFVHQSTTRCSVCVCVCVCVKNPPKIQSIQLHRCIQFWGYFLNRNKYGPVHNFPPVGST